MLMFERLLFFFEVEIAVFEDGVEPEWLLEPPPTPAARVRSPGLAPGGTSAALLLKKKRLLFLNVVLGKVWNLKF